MAALESMSNLIKASTTSMTSVPKPLKFLRPHYDKLKEIHAKITDPAVKVGVLSVKSFSFVAFKQICKLVCIAE